MPSKTPKLTKKQKHPHPIPFDYDNDVPTYDFLQCSTRGRVLDIEGALNDFIYNLTSEYYLRWEAVVCEEQGYPKTKKQRKMLQDLIMFEEEEREDDRILYINEIARPSEPWYEVARKIVSQLVETVTFDTRRGGNQAIYEGWPNLIEALEKYAIHLSLPEGIESSLEILSTESFHRLNLQLCFDCLSGLGQTDELTLENKDQQYRIKWFIECLTKHKELVRHFNLTLEALLSEINLPEKDKPIFIELMQEYLKLPSERSYLIDYLHDEASILL